jgi:thiol:disulfide interchange protein/DsbC/DsbD-like thiol-disulfide interchange protein
MKILALLLLFVAPLSFAVPNSEDHAELLADILTTPERYVALTIKHEEKWHTYWKNPGDAGIATTFKFENNGNEIELEALEWPTPHRYIEAGDILTYGYEGDPTFFFKLPDSLQGELSVRAQWLICKDICIPGGRSAQMLIDDEGNGIVKSSRSGHGDEELQLRLAALPKKSDWPQDLDFYVSRDGERSLRLDYSIKGFSPDKLDTNRNLLMPFLAPPLGFKREEVRFDKLENALVGKFSVEWDGEYQEPAQPLAKDGRFNPPINVKFLYQSPQGETLLIEKTLESFSPTSINLEDRFQAFSPISGEAVALSNSPSLLAAPEAHSLAWILLLAFLGGLILNLMPCVLPVISIKLFGLIKYQNLPRKRVFLHNVIYSVGVISTFFVLAAVIVFVKSTGEAVGWGFQLQSPLFVLAMVAILFVMSLNLFGLFEFITPGGKSLGNAQTKDGFLGDFFSGVLSTILSTPCSAPFLGTALAFAFASSTMLIFLIFTFVGLGLAFPFLLTGLFPALINFLPRPGAWMEKLKYFLGLTMLITVAWLTDVFLNLVDPAIWLWPLALFFITLFFAFFFRAKISKNPGLNALIFLVPVALILGAFKAFPVKPADRTNQALSSTIWQPFSPEVLKSQTGKWVFIDFTAAWCLTCKVNKKLVLDTDEFISYTASKGIVLMRGDWTQRDDVITNFLKSYNIVGVPAYFIQKPDGTIISLGETISIGKMKEHIQN